MLVPVSRRLKNYLLTMALSSPLLTSNTSSPVTLPSGCLLRCRRSSLTSGASTVLYSKNDGVDFSVAEDLACHRETRRTVLTRCSRCLLRCRRSHQQIATDLSRFGSPQLAMPFVSPLQTQVCHQQTRRSSTGHLMLTSPFK